jgi:hypothetical protein
MAGITKNQIQNSFYLGVCLGGLGTSAVAFIRGVIG